MNPFDEFERELAKEEEQVIKSVKESVNKYNKDYNKALAWSMYWLASYKEARESPENDAPEVKEEILCSLMRIEHLLLQFMEVITKKK